MNARLLPLVFLSFTLISACGGSSSSSTSSHSTPKPSSEVPQTRFAMANGCYALQSVKTAKYFVAAAESGYAS